MRRSLKTTTAIIASLNLAIPFPALAQSQDALARIAEACVDVDSEQCQVAVDEAAAAGADSATIEGILNGDITPAPEAPVETAPAEEAPAEAAPTEEAPAAEAPTEAAPAEEAPVEAETAAPETLAEPAAPEAPVEAAPTVDETPADSAPEAEAAPVDEVPSEDTAPEAEVEADVEADAEVEAEAEAEAAPADDGPSTEELEQSLQETSEAEQPAEDAPVAEQAPADTVEQANEEAAAPETETAPADDGPSSEELEQSLSEGESVTTVEDDTTAETETAPVEDQQEATVAEQAAMEGSAPTAAAAAEDAEVMETETETVTEETARSSTEDFDSEISRSADDSAASTATAASGGDDGLSKLEKGLLLGAGALAVGALLRNNQPVVASSDDRVVVSRGEGDFEIIKDDNALLRQPGAEVQTQTFDDGSSRTTVSYQDGSQVVTIRDADLRVVRRVRITPNGERVVLIDDLNDNVQPVNVQTLRETQQREASNVDLSNEEALRQALASDMRFDRSYSLSQVRNIREVRSQVPAVNLEAITFDSGSAAIRPEQADELRALGQFIRRQIADNPRSVFLVEGHTDAVGDAAYNLALSDRRAESVALALSQYFDVPPSNMVVQGYGERFLRVNTQADERANRRATVRNITPLLQTAAAN